MPTYQYACTDSECGNRFELVQSFTDPAATECPVCHHGVRKVYGSVGVVFKGPGFYRTDSRSSATSSSSSESGAKSGATSESTSESKSDGASKSESKSDSKTDAKPAAKSGSSTAGRAAASA